MARPSSILEVTPPNPPASSLLTIRITIPTIAAGDAVRLHTELAAVLDTAIAAAQSVHLDASEVVIMSSRGFESLLLLHRACSTRGIPLTLSKVPASFHELLDRMGFLRLMPFQSR